MTNAVSYFFDLIHSHIALKKSLPWSEVDRRIFRNFGLVFCGTGAIVINQESGGVVTHMELH
jgi:hypothetical protein